MVKYILRRLVISIVTIWLIATASFFLLHLLPEAAETWGKRVVTAAPVLAQAVIITVLIWGIMQIKSSEIQPFIYFQF